MSEKECKYTEKTEERSHLSTAIWSLAGALAFSFILYSITIYNSQFVTARELKPLEKSIIEGNIRFGHIQKKLDKMDKDIGILIKERK